MSKKTIFMTLTHDKRRIFIKLPNGRSADITMAPIYETDDPDVIKALKEHPAFKKTFRIADDKDFRKFSVSIELTYQPTVQRSREFDPNGEMFRDALYEILHEVFEGIEGEFSLEKIDVYEYVKEEKAQSKKKKEKEPKEEAESDEEDAFADSNEEY